MPKIKHKFFQNLKMFLYRYLPFYIFSWMKFLQKLKFQLEKLFQVFPPKTNGFPKFCFFNFFFEIKSFSKIRFFWIQFILKTLSIKIFFKYEFFSKFWNFLKLKVMPKNEFYFPKTEIYFKNIFLWAIFLPKLKLSFKIENFFKKLKFYLKTAIFKKWTLYQKSSLIFQKHGKFSQRFSKNETFSNWNFFPEINKKNWKLELICENVFK